MRNYNKTNERYAAFIKAVYDATKDQAALLTNRMAREYKVSVGIIPELVHLGLLKVTGKKGKTKEYRWNNGEPNLALASNIRTRINEKVHASKAHSAQAPEAILIQKGGEVQSITRRQFNDLVMKEVMAKVNAMQKPRRRLALRNPFYWKPLN